ncbi:acyl-CoA thioesterase [Blastococcus sp. PRF04-17]|uniref:acyl-CoA thioesterase n=1 Tax=Blastococcus sp. PRF04-17 TaxID=2933797 RepID=UPI001FF5B7F8|nr:thioesterase family protein [Blastococcus sp. PRF04-17]UOY03620.1 acyl-CoA thioesterase [Blastococcus sp. PRF04-17]
MSRNGEAVTAAHFPVVWPVSTRWSDNDMFGHLNNAVYYQLFDSAINGWLARDAGVDPMTMPAIGVVAESGCRFLAEARFPDPLAVGIAVTRLGRSSVTYELGLLRAASSGADDHATGQVVALGHWVHVYVDRDSGKPTPVPDHIRRLLTTATRSGS